MAVLQPPDFAAIIARAPNNIEQGSMFGAAVLDKDRRTAQLLGDYMGDQAELEATRMAADARLREAKIVNENNNSLGARLARIAPLLGAFGGGNRLAGQALSPILGQGFMTPSQVIADLNTQLQQTNLFRAQMEPWTSGSKAAGAAALRGSFG
jgi:hypothetical protein